MSKMKHKKLFKAIAVILISALVISGSFGLYILYRFNCDKSGNKEFSYDSVFTAERVSLETDDNGVFRVLKINDTHFFDGVCENDKRTLSGLKKVLDETPCDFIVVNGDLVDGFNLKLSYDKFGAIDLFASLIEEYDTPWTFAPGNNDCEIDGKNEDIIAFMMKYEHFICGNEKGIDGSVQFSVDITHGGEKVHAITVMDSGTRKPVAFGPYQPMSENQAKWLDEEVKKNGVRTSVFFHMPTNGFKDAYDKGESVEGIEKYETFPYAEKARDGVFDEIIGDNELITLLSCAHQHSNNMCSFYNGRYYQLSCAGGYSAMRNSFITPSCTLTVINTLDENVRTMYSFSQLPF